MQAFFYALYCGLSLNLFRFVLMLHHGCFIFHFCFGVGVFWVVFFLHKSITYL